MPVFIDAHVHFFDHDAADLRWSWLEPGFQHPRLKDMHRLDAARFTGPELRAEAGTSAPGAVVHIQSATVPDRPARESEWLDELAGHDVAGWPGAIVGMCSLRAPDAAATLARHADASARCCGVRDMSLIAGFDPDDVVAAVRSCARRGWSIEMLVTHEHFPDVATVARRVPEARIVLGHNGLPIARDDEYRNRWRSALARLSEHDNVIVKISALASGADPNWSAGTIGPFVLDAIECFGPTRSMFGSNWPIDRLCGTYGELIGAYQEISASISDGERAAVFAVTAADVYGLELTGD